jgi:hypothetical protein
MNSFYSLFHLQPKGTIFTGTNAFKRTNQGTPMNIDNIKANPGEFLAIARRDDTGELILSVINDIPQKTKISDICRRVLFEMGQRDPMVYEFLALVYSSPRGGSRVILDQAKLRRFVYAVWGGGRRG